MFNLIKIQPDSVCVCVCVCVCESQPSWKGTAFDVQIPLRCMDIFAVVCVAADGDNTVRDVSERRRATND